MTTAPAQTLHLARFGQGQREVLALHCTMAHSGAWRGLSKALGDTATLIAPDMFCHGNSPDWDGQGDFLDRMAQAVSQCLHRPMDVIGHSFGACVALRVAVLHPEMVRSLTIIESVQMSFVRNQEPELMAAQARSSEPFRQALEAGDFILGARLFNRGWGGDRWDSLGQPAQAAMARGVQIVPVCGPGIVEDRPGMTLPGALDSVGMPVLLLRGARTEPLIAKVHDELERRLPRAEQQIVPEAGHMLPVTHPAETAAAISRVFARSP